MKHYIIKLSLFMSLILLPLTANANVIWPSLFIVESYYTWYVIALGLIIEFFASKLFLKTSWGKSAITTLTMNTISALAGIVLIPASGILVEIILLPWKGMELRVILDYILAVLCNVLIEGAVLKWIFKYPFKKNFLWLLGANALSVIISILVLIIE